MMHMYVMIIDDSSPPPTPNPRRRRSHVMVTRTERRRLIDEAMKIQAPLRRQLAVSRATESDSTATSAGHRHQREWGKKWFQAYFVPLGEVVEGRAFKRQLTKLVIHSFLHIILLMI
jgi:hypothetical protein